MTSSRKFIFLIFSNRPLTIVYNLTDRVVKYQGFNTNRNSDSIKNGAFSSTYIKDGDNIIHVIEDSIIVIQNIESSDMNHDHPRITGAPNRNDNVALTIFHQNIRGLHNKIEELLNCWTTEFPHLLCFTEHHLRDYEIINTYIEGYNLGTKYCRKNRKQGGVAIFVHETLAYSTIEFPKNSNEQEFEVCAIKLQISLMKIYVLSVYRPPTGNVSYFLGLIETILNQLYNNSTNIIICGDININYLDNTKNKRQLDALLASYGLLSIVNFPTRIKNCSSTAIDNIFIDKR